MPTSASKTQIVNIALRRIGVSKITGDVDVEESEEAEAARDLYDLCLREVLEDFEWNFATKYKALELVEEEPNNDWGYYYEYPADCVFARRLVTVLGKQDHSPAPFEVVHHASGQVIASNVTEPVLEYTAYVEETARFTSKFVSALAWKLAENLAPAIQLENSARVSAVALEKYKIALGEAEAASANEATPHPEPEPSTIRVR